ncbi:MAG TPA: hypothetical protein VIP11_21100, partial [Gemmatimonadaceae bacterium]
MRSISRALHFATPFAAWLLIAFSPLASQTAVTQAGGTSKKVLGVDDYSRWRSIGNSSISGDGKWVTYVLSQTNTAPTDAKPVMHLLNLGTNQDVE